MIKRNDKYYTTQEVRNELLNVIFKSKESDGVEHIDMSYDNFIKLIEELAESSYDDGYDSCADNY